MRISIVIGPYLPMPPVLGGAVEKAFWSLSEALRAAGHDVTIISRRHGNLAENEVVAGIRHIRIPSFRRRSSLAANLALGFCYSLRAIFALPPSDITITNEFFLPILLPRRRAGKIYVQVGRYPKSQMWLYGRADRLQAVSRSVADAIARQTPRIAKKTKVIGYAISEVYFEPARPVEREKTVLYVGRIAREKGIELLLRALRLVDERRGASNADQWKLRIVGPHAVAEGGDGEAYFASLKSLAEPLGSRCTFAGPIFDQNALILEYRRSTIFVYPSVAEFGEALGLAPLEAMACGCAAVVSNLRCFDDFIEHGVSGLRFEQNTSDATEQLADQLEQLMTGPRLLKEVAANGYRAACKYRATAIAETMIADFRSLTGIEDRRAARTERASA